MPLLQVGEGDFGNYRTNFIAQTDVKKKWMGLNWETGIKTSILQFDNHAKYVKTIAGITMPDVFRTSNYSFKEQVNAGLFTSLQKLGFRYFKIGFKNRANYYGGKAVYTKGY